MYFHEKQQNTPASIDAGVDWPGVLRRDMGVRMGGTGNPSPTGADADGRDGKPVPYGSGMRAEIRSP